MPTYRQPIDLVKAKGKKHLTKAEYEQRKAEEIIVPFTDIEPPAYLKGKKRIDEFNDYANKLAALNIFTELDTDCLAKYILAKELYLTYTKQLQKIMSKANAVRRWDALDSLADICDNDGTIEDIKKLLEKIYRRERGDDATVLMNMQDKAFKQCLACARELGLTVSARCRLVVPQVDTDDDDEL